MTRTACFSILYRIVGGATHSRHLAAFKPIKFQYPLSDRGWCNLNVCAAACRKPAAVSVSSIGSWVVQPTLLAAVALYLMVFQYPLSDRGWCNLTTWQDAFEAWLVSVSSIGSWVVQQRLCRAIPSFRFRFSILYRIVGGATRRAWNAGQTDLQVSVSSIGSWVVQRQFFRQKLTPFPVLGVPGAFQRLFFLINHTSKHPVPQNRFCPKSRGICGGRAIVLSPLVTIKRSLCFPRNAPYWSMTRCWTMDI